MRVVVAVVTFVFGNGQENNIYPIDETFMTESEVYSLTPTGTAIENTIISDSGGGGGGWCC